MHPLAHHTGEQALTPMLLLGGAWLSLLLTSTRSRLASTRERLATNRRQDAPAGMAVASSHERAPGR